MLYKLHGMPTAQYFTLCRKKEKRQCNVLCQLYPPPKKKKEGDTFYLSSSIIYSIVPYTLYPSSFSPWYRKESIKKTLILFWKRTMFSHSCTHRWIPSPANSSKPRGCLSVWFRDENATPRFVFAL